MFNHKITIKKWLWATTWTKHQWVSAPWAAEEWRHRHGGINIFYHFLHKEHRFWQSLVVSSAFVEVCESSREVLAHHWSKKHPRMHAFLRMTGAVSLCLHHPSSKVSQLSANRLLGPWVLPWRIVRVCEYLASPGCGMLPKRPTTFSPHPEYWVENCMTAGQWEVGKTAARAQNKMYQRDTIPTNNFVDHIRKPTHEPLGVQRLWIPTVVPQAPPKLCIPHPHTTPLTLYLVDSSLCMHLK